MNEMRLEQIEMLYLLWALPLLAAVLIYAGHRRRQALAKFAEQELLPRIAFTVNVSRRRWKAVLLMAAFALSIFALARPAWNPVEQEVQRRGRDVVFLLDVSKSMLAEDLAPNRLERAKLAILDAVDRLEGDRVALVAFAGTAVVKCPPTYDYGFFRMAVEDIEVDSVTRGGTLIGDAIRTTIEQVFTDETRGHRDLVLITDGEDHESFPVEAARQLGQMEIRLIAIGLGDEGEGRRIPVRGLNGQMTFLQYNGQEVWSRLDADTLRKMVNETPGGRYLNVATGTIDFGDVYVNLIASAEQTELGTARFRQYEEKYQIFLTMAFLFLCLEIGLRERKRAMPVIAILLLALASSVPAVAQSARSLVGEGNRAYADKQFPEALEHYKDAESLKPDSPQIWFNKGDALYQQGKFSEAIDAYEQAAAGGRDSRLEALSKYNQGNASFQSGKTKGQANPGDAIAAMQRGVELYHDALDLDPSMDAARHNIEVTKRAIQELLQFQQQQKQQQSGSGEGGQDQQQQQQQQASGSNQQDQQDRKEQQQAGDQQQQEQEDQQQQAGQQQQQEQDEQQQQAQQQGQQQEQQQAIEQAAEDPKDILNEERENRLQRQIQANVELQPVDRDW